MKLLSMIILNQKQHFSLEKKVSSKELRVQIWTETTKILNLILRLYHEKDETTNITGPLYHALLMLLSWKNHLLYCVPLPIPIIKKR